MGAADDGEVDTSIGCHFLDVGDHAIDADGAGDGVGFGHDVVGSAGDVVATGSGIATHGYDDRFVVGDDIDFAPDKIGGCGRATR